MSAEAGEDRTEEGTKGIAEEDTRTRTGTTFTRTGHPVDQERSHPADRERRGAGTERSREEVTRTIIGNGRDHPIGKEGTHLADREPEGTGIGRNRRKS